VLSRMGNTPRGWSAHRKGCPTRVLQRELLRSGGKAVAHELEQALVRFGGWDTQHGVATMRQRYVQSVLDDYLHSVGLALGVDMTDAERTAKEAEWRGAALPPPPISSVLEVKLPTTIQLLCYHDPLYCEYQNKLDAAGKALMAIARADDGVSLVDKEAAGADLFAGVCRRHAHTPACKVWFELRAGQARQFNNARGRSVRLVNAYIDDAFGLGTAKRLKADGCSSLVAPYQFGGFLAAGDKAMDGVLPVDFVGHGVVPVTFRHGVVAMDPMEPADVDDVVD